MSFFSPSGFGRILFGVAALICSSAQQLSAQQSGGGCVAGAPPSVTLDTRSAGAIRLSGHACNIDTNKIKVVIYALTNQWYVQPLTATPFTNIAADGSWSSSTNPWSRLVVLLVDPTNYSPAATQIDNPALDTRVLASTIYPAGPINISFSGRIWGIKMTGDAPGNKFDPGPNFWTNDPAVVQLKDDGLHLKIAQINGTWNAGEVYLTESLGYGTYTMQIASRLDHLDQNTVAAPLFIYTSTTNEIDNEYSGSGGLVPAPDNAQFVAQPFTRPGNVVRYVQPPSSQFTTQMEWAADHVTFRSWNGWTSAPGSGDLIQQWTYTGASIPRPGDERVRANIWLLNGAAPISGTGDELILKSFSFQGVPKILTGGVTPVFSASGSIQPGEWASIYGNNLAASNATWNGEFPTSLGGTSVTIDGKPAYLSFVSPEQINLQVPDDATIGPVTVAVTTASGTATATVNLAQFAPSLLLLDSRHVAGIILRQDGSGAYGGGTYDIIGPTGSSLGYRTVASKAGDSISLFGTGFGPTNPPVLAGHAFGSAAPTTNGVSVLINNVSVATTFTGLSGAGLDQINLTIPPGLGTGEVPIVVSVGGPQTQDNIVISLE